MTRQAFRIAALLLPGALSFQAQSSLPTSLTGFPFTDEDLNYVLKWPGGLNLGDAHLHAKHSGTNWNFGLTVSGGIPGFQVNDTYHSGATTELCSTFFDRSMAHGSRSTDEKETVDRSRGLVARATKNGGESNIQVPDCFKDALTYLFYSRQELGQGRVPPAQQVLFGGLYKISLVYTGAPMITVGEKQVQSDEIVCTVKGPSSAEYKFEVYFARDAARSPLLIKAPFSMGTFSMELIR